MTRGRAASVSAAASLQFGHGTDAVDDLANTADPSDPGALQFGHGTAAVDDLPRHHKGLVLPEVLQFGHGTDAVDASKVLLHCGIGNMSFNSATALTPWMTCGSSRRRRCSARASIRPRH